MSDPDRIPTWQEGTDALLAKLPHLVAEGEITVNDARVIQYLAGLLPREQAVPPALLLPEVVEEAIVWIERGRPGPRRIDTRWWQ